MLVLLFFTIDKPWWQGWWGIGLLIVAFLCLAVAATVFYRKKKRILEIMLLQGKSSQEFPSAEASFSLEDVSASSEAELSPSDDFKYRLVILINQHISESDYGVEQLAKDLCMERTGLYKKLKMLTDESPVSFIRNVRLEKAAEMLKSFSADAMTVNEIAERAGFASPSYFTKCFKAKYGVKPSEYR